MSTLGSLIKRTAAFVRPASHLEAARAALDDVWRTQRQIWKRADIGAETSMRHYLTVLIHEGFAEQRRIQIPTGFRNEFRRKPQAAE